MKPPQSTRNATRSSVKSLGKTWQQNGNSPKVAENPLIRRYVT
jgi:hypothetical protein